MTDRSAALARVLHADHGWSIAECALFFSPVSEYAVLLQEQDVLDAWSRLTRDDTRWWRDVERAAVRIAAGEIPGTRS